MKSQNRNRASRAAGGKKASVRVADGTRPAEPKAPNLFPIVGVGASAGGLEAFSQLLRNLPAETGMAFVLVQHLDPGHESALTQILARTTPMRVSEVTHGMAVAPNQVYVIPPNTRMEIAKGVLKLRPRDKTLGPLRSIDAFFESLAQDRREQAIGVILSGTATDGTQGLEMIQAEGGITIAQDESAKYDSMPRNAVGAGCVDLVLSPDGIAKELARIAKHPLLAARRTNVANLPPSRATPPADGDESPVPADDASAAPPSGGENALKKILLLLRAHCGVDFSLYKLNTIHRRITRRMVLNKLTELGHYARFLKGNSKELDLLYSDLLIGVTSFFRNPEAFAALKLKVFPDLVAHRRGDDPVRVWTLGCSSGQEAYSIAMAFTEFCDKIPRAPRLQIFAMDLNESQLEKARHGLYTKSQIADVSPERLKRFFVEEQGGYRICKSLRELCIFARQNVLSDPPFSRMDLISCRNLLIYIEPGLQKKILPNFHYALKPEGFLFLGASESIGPFTNLFAPADKKQKIFSKKPGLLHPFHLPASKGRQAEKKGVLSSARPTRPEGFRAELGAEREADRVMVNHYAPPSVLINDDLEVLQFRGPTGEFLVPPTGKASFNVLKMARAGLMLPLRASINEARNKNSPVSRKNVRLDDNGRAQLVNIKVIPLKNLKERCFLILLELVAKPGRAGRSPPEADLSRGGAQEVPPSSSKNEAARRVAELERELAEARDYAQALQEQHEAANEELQASSEEGRSANEELQSIIEELETSKEELESTNEELITVNEEMASRNTELNRLNSDLTNLQNSTRFPIVLLGENLAIRRFSPQAEKQFNLVATDVGRPFGNVRHNLEFPELEAFIQDVIAKVRERECEVRDGQGHWHLLQVRPYFTSDNQVDGAVLVLVDIEAIKESEKAVVLARDYAEAIIRTARDPLLILDAELRVERANEAFYTTFKISRTESAGRPVFELDGGDWDIPKLRELLQDILPRRSFFNHFEVTHTFKNIGLRTMLLNARTLSETDGQPARILLGIQDISELLHFQAQTRRSELRYRRLFEAGRDGVLIMDPATRKILDANPFMTELLGYPHEALLGKELFEIGLLKDEAASRAAFEELQNHGFIRYENLPLETKTGRRREVEFVSNLYEEGGVKVIQCNIRDITERKRVEKELAEKARMLDLANDPIIVRDFEGRILYWNHSAEELYGWTREEAIGKISNVLLQTEYPVPLEQITRELYQHNRWSGQLVHVKRDGTRITVLARKALDRDSHGNPASVVENLTDISERIQAREALSASEERYRNLFNCIDEGFCVVEMLFDEAGKPADYRFLEVNPSFEKQTGIAGATGRRMREFAPNHEAFWFEVYGNVVLTGQSVRFISKANELNRWFDVYAFRIGGVAERKVAILFTDITERTLAEAALRDAQVLLSGRADELEKAVADRTSELTTTNKQLEALVYSIAHDLRAPLRAMQGFSTMLIEEEGVAFSQTGLELAGRISTSAQMMDALLMGLVTFSGIAQQRLNLGPVKLDVVMEFLRAHLEKEIQESGAHVQMDGPWPVVLGHEGMLGLVLTNLVANALKFVAPNVPPMVRLRFEEQGKFIRIWVEDNGIGIAPAYHSQIFRLFTRLHGKKYSGTGIGLALVEKAVERMGGRAGVESDSDGGSRFWLELEKA